jgi:hypothetical protein
VRGGLNAAEGLRSATACVGNQVFDAGADQAFAFGDIALDKPVVGKW